MISEIKICPIHGETEFHYYEKQGRSGQWKCLKCEAENAVLKKQKYKYKAVLQKGGKCEICGYDKNVGALEFHHIDPSTKSFTISDTQHSWEDTLKELDKCILICANCHREIHNPLATFENIERILEEHNKKISKPKEFPYTLEELLQKRSECNNWEEVAKFYGVSLATIKRHKKILEEK